VVVLVDDATGAGPAHHVALDDPRRLTLDLLHVGHAVLEGRGRAARPQVVALGEVGVGVDDLDVGPHPVQRARHAPHCTTGARPRARATVGSVPAMATAEIDGTLLAYEIIGDGGDQPWVLTPGGRFSKDVPGIRELGEALAEHGKRVLIWDRPNCGASDVCFTGSSESQMQADRLAGLLRHLDMAPAVIFGGSGGVYGLLLLATHYCGESIRAAWAEGMEGVLELPEWAEVLERNPRNRDIFL